MQKPWVEPKDPTEARIHNGAERGFDKHPREEDRLTQEDNLKMVQNVALPLQYSVVITHRQPSYHTVTVGVVFFPSKGPSQP